MSDVVKIFKQLNNALLDLQASQLQTFERPMRVFGKLLQAGELSQANDKLIEGLNLDGFLERGSKTGGSFVGSKHLDWPDEPEKVLGLQFLLILRFAENPQFAMDFSFEYYYSGNKLMANLHSLVSQLFIPFLRDYKEYVLNASPRSVMSEVNESNSIFVVHGHDGEAREAVARYLEQLGFTAIILHEQANQGRTVIEKVEANSNVGFAVVLLTPDDEGCSKGGKLEPRARQNVLLELGYFIGKLGRSKVCALKKGVVEIPSDFAGVVWESMDLGAWKQSLARELKAAGYEIDWNKVMK